MINETHLQPESSVPHKGIGIKVLGVGDAGCNVINHLARESLEGVHLALLNTNARALAQAHGADRLTLGLKTMRGLGTGGDPERGRAAAEADAAPIRSLCAGADMVFVVAGLGGGTGTGAVPVVARTARESGALVLAIVFTPFDCEGTRRLRQAQVGLHELKKAADGVICVPNQKVFKLIDENTSLVDAFGLTNELVAQAVRGIWRLVSRPGLLHVDFADLCAVAQGKHSESSLASAEARGEHRVRDVLDKLRAHPLLEEGQALAEAAGMLVSIAGGPSLTMAEVNRIMEQLNRQAENAHIILGAAVEPELGDALQVTLVASRKGSSDGPARLESATAPAIALPEFQVELMDPAGTTRSAASRFVAPAPELTSEQAQKLLAQQSAGSPRQRRQAAKMRQGQLPLEIVTKGRFEKSEPTIHQGQDLDIPTYVRRGVALN